MKKDSNTKYFKFATTGNPNIRSCDCVVRSISLALDRTWNEVFDDLCDIARIKKRMPNETIIYQEYLKKNAFTKFSCPKKSNNKKYTGIEFLEKIKSLDLNLSAVCHMGSGHMSCIKDNKFMDIWNCSNNCVGNIYIHRPSQRMIKKLTGFIKPK